MGRKNDKDASADDDSGLFRRLMSDTKPLQRSGTASLHKPTVSPRARFARRDEQAVLRESLEADIDECEAGAGESLRFNRASVGKRTMRKLARGNFSVQDEIDLHGMTVVEAKTALREFLDDCALRGFTCIRVVHGKGLGSGQRGPILKSKVNNWLRRWDHVLAFVSTRQIDGGTGAVYVLLRKNPG
jgi:DNA-nicking Smr family endonuclease